MSEKPLSLRTKVAYAAPAFVLTLLGMIYYAYLPKFYAEKPGLNLNIIGYLILASRVFDAISAPLMGYLSDRYKGKHGRRKVFIRYGVLPLVLSFYFLLNPPQSLSAQISALWFAGFSFLFFLCWTVVTVPYESWGPELSPDYDERTGIFSFREGAVLLGSLFAVLLTEALRTLSGDEAVVFQAVAIIYGLLLLSAVLNCLKWVPEKAVELKKISSRHIFRNVFEVLNNRHLLILLASYSIAVFGAALPATLIFFYVQDVLGSKLGGIFMLLYFLVGFISVPVWSKLAVIFGKKQACLWAMLINSAAFMFVLILGKGDQFWYGLLLIISALGFGGMQILPAAMQADVIDVDRKNYGLNREGQIVGIWSVSKKLAAALGTGISLPVLALYGYRVSMPNIQSAENSAEALKMLSFLYAGVPCLCGIISILILTRYNLDKEKVRSIRNADSGNPD